MHLCAASPTFYHPDRVLAPGFLQQLQRSDGATVRKVEASMIARSSSLLALPTSVTLHLHDSNHLLGDHGMVAAMNISVNLLLEFVTASFFQIVV